MTADWPLCCPLVWCPASETPMGKREYRQHQRDAHFPARGAYEFPDVSDAGRAAEAAGPPAIADGGESA